MVRAGLSPFQALQSSTLAPAQYLGLEQHSGSIELGKNADLVLLNANPLDDIRHTQQIDGVIFKGKWLPASFLERMKQAVAGSY